MLEQNLFSVGDAMIGKSCVFKTYMENKYDISNVPVLYHCDTPTFTVDGQKVSVGLWDTATLEEVHDESKLAHFRSMIYEYADVFFVCFSVDNKASFKNVEDKWIPEIRHCCPDVPFVIVAFKIDCPSGPFRVTVAISYKQGLNLAKKYVVRYCETSAKKDFGLKKLIRGSDSAPTVEIETSTFGEERHRALQDPRHCDVTFILEDKHHLQAHSVMLCSASKVFAKVLGSATPTVNSQMTKVIVIESYSREQINTGTVPGFVAIYDKEPEVNGEGHVQTVIEMSADISANTFIHVLEFLYSGIPQFTVNAEDFVEDEIRDVDRVASLLNLSQLQAFCCNMLTDQEYLNPSITTALNDETGARLKELFFNKEEKADVVFLVEGEEVYGHKCVLTARCQVMAAMFSGHFAESKSDIITKITIPNTTHEVFLALLECLYTDHAPIDDGDPMGIVVLSAEYGQRRLTNLCELYITKEIDRSVTKRIEKAEIDVIGLLFTARTQNADQLAKWCLFFIASNYMAFEKRKEFHMLKGDNRYYVEENR